MRKIGAIMGIAALAALVSSHLPAGAFGIHLGRFYFHLPLAGRHRHHPMRTNRNEARTRPNESGGDSTAARGRDATEQDDRETRAETNTAGLESCTGLMPAVTNLPCRSIRSDKSSIRQLIRKRLSTISALQRRKQGKSSNRRAQIRFRSHPSLAWTPPHSDWMQPSRPYKLSSRRSRSFPRR